MPHIDPERLALLAMGEPSIAPEDSDHLADCAVCVDELTALRHAALAGRASFDVGDLESPPSAVWDRIATELSLGSADDNAAPDAERGAPAPDHVVTERDHEPASVTPARPLDRHTSDNTSAAHAAGPKSTRGIWRLWALAAALVLVAGAGLGVWAVSQRDSLTEVAEASLAAFPAHDGAEGSAIVEESADGSLAVRVTLSADAAPDTYREVWLITADASALVSLGVLDGSQASFPVPAGVDLRDYVLVDISQEPDDGDSTHSGDSIVRGELTFL